MSSIRTSAAVKANDRMVKPSGGVAMPTTPAPSEKIATATGQPAAVRSNIQRVAGSVHASPTMNEIEKPAGPFRRGSSSGRSCGDEFEPECDADEGQRPPAPTVGGPHVDEQTGGDGEEVGAGAHGMRGARSGAGGLVETRMSVRCRRSVESGTGVRIAHAMSSNCDPHRFQPRCSAIDALVHRLRPDRTFATCRRGVGPGQAPVGGLTTRLPQTGQGWRPRSLHRRRSWRLATSG